MKSEWFCKLAKSEFNNYPIRLSDWNSIENPAAKTVLVTAVAKI